MKTTNAVACRFFSVDDALRWAAASFYGASRVFDHGEPLDLAKGRALFLDAFMAKMLDMVRRDPLTAMAARGWLKSIAEECGETYPELPALPADGRVFSEESLHRLQSLHNPAHNAAIQGDSTNARA